jgi:hypothetical protein
MAGYGNSNKSACRPTFHTIKDKMTKQTINASVKHSWYTS